MAQEIELKLAFPPGALAQILRHPLIAATRKCGPAQQLDNTYFDTPHQTLGRARIALRTRRIGRRVLQTIKCAPASSGGLSSRPEWEHAYHGSFDFSQVDDVPTRSMLETHAGAIVPLFSTVFRRETREYAPRPGVRVLLMIDSGSVQAQGREAPISELELELVEGNAEDLLDLALQLASELPLMPEDISKAERGYRLFHDEPAQALRGRRIALNADMDLREAFLTLAFENLRCWQGNALGVLQYDGPDFVHQLRVALRRMRTLLRLFSRLLPLGFAPNWEMQLARLADDTAGARDLEVLAEGVLATPASAADAPDFIALMQRLEMEKSMAHDVALRVLAHPGSRVLLLQFSQALHTLPALQGKTTDITRFARDCLNRMHKRAEERLQYCNEKPDSENLHSLRIAFKNLRYATEFFSGLYDRKSVETTLRKLAKVLDRFGAFNDVAVGQTYLQKWLHTEPALQPAVSWVNGWHAAGTGTRTRKALHAARSFLGIPPYWKRTRNAKARK